MNLLNNNNKKMRIRKNGTVVNLTESDLCRIVKRVMNEGAVVDVSVQTVLLPESVVILAQKTTGR